MTRITRISGLRGCGVFRDFSWPDELLDFGRYNLIYGWNGTGKTTLSRVFRALELRQQPTMGQTVLRIDGSDVRGEEFPQSTLQLRVFNRDFIHESVFPVGGGDVPPILVVGKESVEKQKEADRLKEERRIKQGELDETRKRKEQAEKDLDRHCIDRARLIKDTLRASGSEYNEYDKRRYREAAQEMAKTGGAATHRLSDSERQSLLAQHRANPKRKVSEVSYRLPNLQELAGKVTRLLETTIASAAIQALKDDSALAEWTRHGLGLHKQRQSNKCLFCDQPLPADRLANLEAHFNAEYERFLQTVDEQILALESADKQMDEVKLPHQAELYDDLATDFDAAEQALRQVLDAARAFIGELVNALKGKKAQPFKTLPVTASVPGLDAAVVDRLTDVIRRHNQACDEFEQRVRAARDSLADDMIAESLEEFVRLRDEAQRAANEVRAAEQDVQRLTAEIDRLEREMVEHRRPADELNEDLSKYLGHGELQLSIKETGYAITRSGQPADKLSEGETTAIALLYFLKSLEDRDFDKASGVIVLDDPVSSLDANALYLAFGFIRERTKDAGQLIILTHNFAFFRQVRNWLHHLKGQNKRDPDRRPARFYMLDCMCQTNGRCASIRPLDPLLEQYDSEYHYLFASIYNAVNGTATAAAAAGLEQNYMLPNVARRLLEAFLAFRQPHLSGELWQKVEALRFDKAKKLRILRFLHTHSHRSGIGEPEHDPSVLGEARSVLADLMELMKSEDAQHFSAMERLVASAAEEVGSE